MDNRPIGVFDSGLGGLTVVRQLIKQLGNENIVYFGDTGRVPYGTRGRETIQKYAVQDVEFLRKQQVKMVIAACGTVSSVMPVPPVSLGVPYTGVVSHAAKAAAERSRNGKIGVIGTTATIRSGAYSAEIARIRPDAVVTARDCPLFVPLVENGFIQRDNQVTRLVAKQYLEPFIAEGIDTLIMGCTHYPLLSDIIFDIFEGKVMLIDPGEETARHAAQFLKERQLLHSQGNGSCRYYVSDSIEGFAKIASMLMGSDITGSVEQIDLDLLVK